MQFKKNNIIFLLWFNLAVYHSFLYANPHESWYQDIWCKGMGGVIEKQTTDGQRIDCLTTTHAIEMDFAAKWHEAIGQALEYSILANKKAGIVLILTKESDLIYWERLNLVVNTLELPITLWKLGP